MSELRARVRKKRTPIVEVPREETLDVSVKNDVPSPRSVKILTPPAIHVQISSPRAPVVSTIGVQGPQGLSEDNMAFAKRTDFVGADLLYKGEAYPGTLTSQAGWRIRRITFDEQGNLVEEWANGNSKFDQVWDDRASLSYS